LFWRKIVEITELFALFWQF